MVAGVVAVANAAKLPMAKSVPRVKAVAVVKPAVNCATALSVRPAIVRHAKAGARVATTTGKTKPMPVQRPNPS